MKKLSESEKRDIVSSKKYIVGGDEKTGMSAGDTPLGAGGERGKDQIIVHAYQLFRRHLQQLRQYAEIKTICMYNQVFYLTDTGRRWDNWKVSVRDKDEAKRRSGF